MSKNTFPSGSDAMTSTVQSMADRASTFAKANVIHSLVWSASSIGLGGALQYGLVPPPSRSFQLSLLVLGTLSLGVCHGAIDWEVGRRTLQGRARWWMVFAFAYLGMVALGAVAWRAERTLVLVTFLVASACHFGSAPPVVLKRDPASAILISALIGSLVISIPSLVYADDVSDIFRRLGATDTDAMLSIASHSYTCYVAGIPVLASAVSLITMVCLKQGLTGLDGVWLFELLAMIALFSATPPILGFTVFFCGLHSPRHVLFLSERLWCSPFWSALCKTILWSLPVTLATAAVSLFFYLLPAPEGIETRTLRILFGGLVIVTFPHMILTALYSRQSESKA